jgi:ribosomal protein S18 acetylase RimI-like enzyme
MTGPAGASGGATVRAPEPGDHEACAELHARVWRATYRGLMADEVVDALTAGTFLPSWQAICAAYAEGSVPQDGRVVRVAVLEGTPVGFLLAGPPRDERPPAPRQVWSLNVDPTHQGTGVAQRLLDEGLGQGPAYLWVALGNERAIAFYRRNGFEPDGVQDDQGQHGVTEVRMVRAGR